MKETFGVSGAVSYEYESVQVHWGDLKHLPTSQLRNMMPRNLWHSTCEE
jgi:hypothetical protein